MKKLLFYSRAILFVSIMGLFTAGCSKTDNLLGDQVLLPSPKTGIFRGFVSPAESMAVVFISNGFFNGRETLFDASVEADPSTGNYVIEDIPQGTYTLDVIPTNPAYMSMKIQDVMIYPSQSNCVNFCLPKK